MVNRSVLRKLSDFELKKYLKEGNRFVPEAVQMAFDILKERGHIFTEQEEIAVQQLIRNKIEAEEAKLAEDKEQWKDHITEDPDAISLFPRELILIISFILGTIPGAILLGINFIKLKKYFPAALAFIFGFVFLPVHNFLVFMTHTSGFKKIFILKRNPEFIIAGLGTLILLGFWVLFTPKKLPYRAASYIFPILICTVMVILIAINYQGLFSNYFLVNLAK